MHKNNSSNHWRLTRQAILLAVVFLFMSCSSGQPSESNATDALNHLCLMQENLCRVKSLKKTDGQASEISKVKHYRLAYQAEVECLRGNVDNRGFSVGLRCVHVGDIKKVAGVFEFVQSESGWHHQPGTADYPKEIQ